MDRAHLSGASGSAPTAPVSPSIGYPTAGSPGVSPATVPGPYLYHMLIEELLAIVTAGGLTPAHGTLNQVLQALPAALASRPEMTRILASTGYQKLPGGLFIVWGATAVVNGTRVTFPATFPTACLVCLVGDISAATGDSIYGQAAGAPDRFGFTFRSAYGAADASNYIAIGY